MGDDETPREDNRVYQAPPAERANYPQCTRTSRRRRSDPLTITNRVHFMFDRSIKLLGKLTTVHVNLEATEKQSLDNHESRASYVRRDFCTSDVPMLEAVLVDTLTPAVQLFRPLPSYTLCGPSDAQTGSLHQQSKIITWAVITWEKLQQGSITTLHCSP
jgi:hypothetical protein